MFAMLLVMLWSRVGPIVAQTPDHRERRAAAVDGAEESAKVDEVVQQIRELQARIDRLLLSLPLELRAAVERRLRSARAEQVAGTERPTETTTEDPTLATSSAAPASRAKESPAEAAVETPDGGKPAFQAEGSASGRAPEAAASLRPRETGDPPTLPTIRACSGVDLFDSNGDGVLSGADRYWRHLFLWLDDGDGQLGERDTVSVFEAGVRQIRLDLGGYTADDGGIGLVDVADRVRFDVVVKKRLGVRTGILLLDADGLARGDGPELLDERGEPLSGLQELRPGLRIGSQPFRCP